MDLIGEEEGDTDLMFLFCLPNSAWNLLKSCQIMYTPQYFLTTFL